MIEMNESVFKQKDKQGNKGFAIACTNNNIEVIKLMIEQKPSVIQ